MSVFSFSKTGKVWGPNNVTTYGMITWWIGQVGPKPYLIELKQSYDHGYNHGDLSEVADADKAELRSLVRLMLETGYARQFTQDAKSAAYLQGSLAEFERLLDDDLEGTAFHRPAGR